MSIQQQHDLQELYSLFTQWTNLLLQNSSQDLGPVTEKIHKLCSILESPSIPLSTKKEPEADFKPSFVFQLSTDDIINPEKPQFNCVYDFCQELVNYCENNTTKQLKIERDWLKLLLACSSHNYERFMWIHLTFQASNNLKLTWNQVRIRLQSKFDDPTRPLQLKNQISTFQYIPEIESINEAYKRFSRLVQEVQYDVRDHYINTLPEKIRAVMRSTMTFDDSKHFYCSLDDIHQRAHIFDSANEGDFIFYSKDAHIALHLNHEKVNKSDCEFHLLAEHSTLTCPDHIILRYPYMDFTCITDIDSTPVLSLTAAPVQPIRTLPLAASPPVQPIHTLPLTISPPINIPIIHATPMSASPIVESMDTEDSQNKATMHKNRLLLSLQSTNSSEPQIKQEQVFVPTNTDTIPVAERIGRIPTERTTMNSPEREIRSSLLERGKQLANIKNPTPSPSESVHQRSRREDSPPSLENVRHKSRRDESSNSRREDSSSSSRRDESSNSRRDESSNNRREDFSSSSRRDESRSSYYKRASSTSPTRRSRARSRSPISTYRSPSLKRNRDTPDEIGCYIHGINASHTTKECRQAQMVIPSRKSVSPVANKRIRKRSEPGEENICIFCGLPFKPGHLGYCTEVYGGKKKPSRSRYK